MKPISVATMIASLLFLGISMLWFPDMLEPLIDLMPVGTPAWLTDILPIMPFAVIGILLLILVLKFSKRGQTKFYEDDKTND